MLPTFLQLFWIFSKSNFESTYWNTILVMINYSICIISLIYDSQLCGGLDNLRNIYCISMAAFRRCFTVVLQDFSWSKIAAVGQRQYADLPILIYWRSKHVMSWGYPLKNTLELLHSGTVDIHDIFTFWMLLLLYVCLLAYTFRLSLYLFKDLDSHVKSLLKYVICMSFYVQSCLFPQRRLFCQIRTFVL
jgi:hypothetical protein